MNRRQFLKGLFFGAIGLAVAPTVLLTPKPEPKPIIVGFKGKSYFEAGIVYAPYIPLTFTSTHL